MKHVNVALFVPHAGCPHMCSFCNQKTISGVCNALTEEDIDNAVNVALNSGKDTANGEIAFFGGSFTAIDRDYMERLLRCAYKYIEKGLFRGIRCSTRPDAIDDEVLYILSSYAVTSIELGAQSMSDKVLSMNDRGHTADDVVKACELIKSYGFELGLQMMTGLYGDDDKTAIETAEKIIALKPSTVRIYPTVVLENTRLATLYRDGVYKPQTLEEAVVLCSHLLKMFNDSGIKVIRLGLHSGGNVDEGYVAGAYHPAFRELCESELYLDTIKDIIKANNIKGSITIKTKPSEVSKIIGQKKCNIASLCEIGVDAKVVASGGVGTEIITGDNYVFKVN